MSVPQQDVQAWLVERVGALTGTPPGEVDVTAQLTRYGLDSVAVITLATELENRFGVRFHGNPFDDQPTIEALARHIADTAGGKS